MAAAWISATKARENHGPDPGRGESVVESRTTGRDPRPAKPRPALRVDGLERRELLSTLTVSGQANIYGAGLMVPPAPGGGGGGVLPKEVDLSTLGNPAVLDFPSVTGTVSGWAAAGGYNGPDGGPSWGGVTNVPAWRGISGIQDAHATMFLVGVFLGPNGQPAQAPATPNVTGANGVASSSPLIGQQFFIGDGRTASQFLQTINVPAARPGSISGSPRDGASEIPGRSRASTATTAARSRSTSRPRLPRSRSPAPSTARSRGSTGSSTRDRPSPSRWSSPTPGPRPPPAR